MQRELQIAQQLQRHPNVVNWWVEPTAASQASTQHRLTLLPARHCCRRVDIVMNPLGSNDVAIIFEYAGGGDARRLLERGPLPEPIAREVFKQIISGVAHCHMQVTTLATAWSSLLVSAHPDGV